MYVHRSAQVAYYYRVTVSHGHLRVICMWESAKKWNGKEQKIRRGGVFEDVLRIKLPRITGLTT